MLLSLNSNTEHVLEQQHTVNRNLRFVLVFCPEGLPRPEPPPLHPRAQMKQHPGLLQFAIFET